MRHFALTGRLLDPRLTMRQIIGLRFASDAEFAGLADRAAAEKLSLDEIKKAVKTWRATTTDSKRFHQPVRPAGGGALIVL